MQHVVRARKPKLTAAVHGTDPLNERGSGTAALNHGDFDCGYFLTAGSGCGDGSLSFLYFSTSLFVGFQTFGLFSDGIPGIRQHESAQIKHFIFTIGASC